MKTEIHKTIQIKQANAGRKPISRLSQDLDNSLFKFAPSRPNLHEKQYN